MAGTLTITTLSDGTNSTSATNCIQGSAKAWVNFNGTGTVAIRASYNVSSITDNGTGDYTINFTNAFSDTNYVALGTCNINLVGNNSRLVSAPVSQAPTTSSIRITTTVSSSTAMEDMQFVYVSVFR
jgi:hypothetical protein